MKKRTANEGFKTNNWTFAAAMGVPVCGGKGNNVQIAALNSGWDCVQIGTAWPSMDWKKYKVPLGNGSQVYLALYACL